MILLQNETLRAQISPEAGASLVSLAIHRGDEWVDLMRPTSSEAIVERDAWSMASFILAPFSNVIPQGCFRFASQIYQLASNYEGGSAIHGDVYRRAWQVAKTTPDSLICTLDSRHFSDFNFPFPLSVEVHYSMAENEWVSSLSLTNIGDRPMPAGLGFHPFFNRCLGRQDDCQATLQFNASGVYPKLPSGPMQPVASVQDFSTPVLLDDRALNHCYGGWEGFARIAYPGAGLALELECDRLFSHVVVFTPSGEPYFCVEPVSHANNAFNLAAGGQPETGMRILPPGERIGGAFRLRVV